METPSHEYTIDLLSDWEIGWFVETAAVEMLTYELKSPEFINIPQLYKLAQQGMDDKTAFVCRYKGILVGALGSLLVPNVFNPDILTLSEIFWYVSPEYRGTRAGMYLLNAFEKRAEELQVNATLSLLPGSKIGEKTLPKRGFIMEELAFRKKYGSV